MLFSVRALIRPWIPWFSFPPVCSLMEWLGFGIKSSSVIPSNHQKLVNSRVLKIMMASELVFAVFMIFSWSIYIYMSIWYLWLDTVDTVLHDWYFDLSSGIWLHKFEFWIDLNSRSRFGTLHVLVRSMCFFSCYNVGYHVLTCDLNNWSHWFSKHLIHTNWWILEGQGKQCVYSS